VLERALAYAPDHPGANHFYIHAMEDSPFPERALASADRLRSLVPGAGHMVHMSSHIYYRIGRYDDAALANEEAIAADRAYLMWARSDPSYVSGYVAHNYHYLWASLMMTGRSADALAAAGALARYANESETRGNGTIQHFSVLPLLTLVRYGKWREILAAERPPLATAYTNGIWRYARGIALSRSGDVPHARMELGALEASIRSLARDGPELKGANPLWKLADIAADLLRAEVAAAEDDDAAAIRFARQALKAETALASDEPPPWCLPARHTLGALLLKAGRLREAERIYREDLAAQPANGWGLAGLAQALARQGKPESANEVRKRLARVWASGDVKPDNSRM
jgi:tetratricopeptide (TPR) repeat protein